MDLYDRQSTLKLKVPNTVTIVGCGGTGFWAGIFLAMSGVERLILVDDDVIEDHNRNRLPIPYSYVGLNKTDALSRFIRDIATRSCIIEQQKLKIDKDNISMILTGSVFCCTDNIKSQQLIQAYCKKTNLKYQRIGYDGTMLNVSRSFPMTFTDENLAGYEVVPSWVCPTALASAAGVASQLYKEITLMDDMSNLVNQDTTIVSKGIKTKIYEQVTRNPGDWGLGRCGSCDQNNNCDDCDRGDCDECDYQGNEYNQDYINEYYTHVDIVENDYILRSVVEEEYYHMDHMNEEYIDKEKHNEEIEGLHDDIDNLKEANDSFVDEISEANDKIWKLEEQILNLKVEVKA